MFALLNVLLLLPSDWWWEKKDGFQDPPCILRQEGSWTQPPAVISKSFTMLLHDTRNADLIVTLLQYFQIVILKELKHSDGNFDETQRIELNAVKHEETQTQHVVCGVLIIQCPTFLFLCSSSKSTITTSRNFMAQWSLNMVCLECLSMEREDRSGFVWHAHISCLAHNKAEKIKYECKIESFYQISCDFISYINRLRHTQMAPVPSFFQYVLNDMVSYPEETFMDWEFKISVMYDIAKVRQKVCRWTARHSEVLYCI